MYEHDVLECIVLECTVGAGPDGFVSKAESPILFLYSYLTEKVLNTIATGGISSTGLVLAKAVGAGPEVARDVGQAMARNRVPLIIPCHRVLAAGGKVGGFSAPGGAATKVRMLELEGVRVGPPPPAQQSLAF